MKLASITNAVKKHNDSLPFSNSVAKEHINHIIVHTGQHYDEKMSQSFFTDLGIPKPDINLEVGSGSHAEQTANIMKKFEPVLLKEKPDVLLVVGDVNSTIACALVASKITYPQYPHIKRPIIVHVEAGLRSFDHDMPEEINRILTDAISDLLFVTEESATTNLHREGVSPEKIHFVGNVMIDTLIRHIEKAKAAPIKKQLGITLPYGVVTLHRPSNVDNKKILTDFVKCLIEISKDLPLYFPMHPRTKNNIDKFGLNNLLVGVPTIQVGTPLGYLDFLNLVQDATVVITDSGGIQEETTYLKVPCVTLRNNTERPVTVTEGSNYLIGTDRKKIMQTISSILAGEGKSSQIPKYWDGKTGERIVKILVNLLK